MASTVISLGRTRFTAPVLDRRYELDEARPLAVARRLLPPMVQLDQHDDAVSAVCSYSLGVTLARTVRRRLRNGTAATPSARVEFLFAERHRACDPDEEGATGYRCDLETG